MPKRDSYHHGDLRRALIDAAVELIIEADIDSLSLRQVARKVGVSHAAPYRHFEDKEALLAVVAEEGFRDFTRYLKAAVEQSPTDPRQQLIDSGIAYLRYALDHPGYYQVMFGKFPVMNSPYPGLCEAADASFAVLLNLIIRGQQAGIFRASAPDAMALCAWSQVHGLAMLLLAKRVPVMGEAAIATLSTSLTELLLQGFAAPPESQMGRT